MAMFYILCAGLLCVAQAQYLPLSAQIPPCQQVVSPCQQVVSPCQQVVSPCQQPISPCQQTLVSPPVVATTIVDNSVSNALANALQLLIVSNLIENTMNSPCGCGLSAGCDCGPSIYSSGIEVIAPPCAYVDPITPCDFIAPCEPVIEVIPNGCYPDILPIPNVGCGCGCDSPFIPNIGPNFGSPCGCGNNFPSLQSLLPSLLPNIGLPNIGCGCKGQLSSLFGFDQYGPDFFSGCNGYGGPNYRVGYDNFGYDSCPNRCYGNGPYYF